MTDEQIVISSTNVIRNDSNINENTNHTILEDFNSSCNIVTNDNINGIYNENECNDTLITLPEEGHNPSSSSADDIINTANYTILEDSNSSNVVTTNNLNKIHNDNECKDIVSTLHEEGHSLMISSSSSADDDIINNTNHMILEDLNSSNVVNNDNEFNKNTFTLHDEGRNQMLSLSTSTEDDMPEDEQENSQQCINTLHKKHDDDIILSPHDEISFDDSIPAFTILGLSFLRDIPHLVSTNDMTKELKLDDQEKSLQCNYYSKKNHDDDSTLSPHDVISFDNSIPAMTILGLSFLPDMSHLVPTNNMTEELELDDKEKIQPCNSNNHKKHDDNIALSPRDEISFDDSIPANTILGLSFLQDIPHLVPRNNMTEELKLDDQEESNNDCHKKHDDEILLSPHDVISFGDSITAKTTAIALSSSLLNIPHLVTNNYTTTNLNDTTIGTRHNNNNCYPPRYIASSIPTNNVEVDGDEEEDDDDIIFASKTKNNGSNSNNDNSLCENDTFWCSIVCTDKNHRNYGFEWMEHFMTSSCPCCQQNLDFLTTLNEPKIMMLTRRNRRRSLSQQQIAIQSLFNDVDDYDTTDDESNADYPYDELDSNDGTTTVGVDSLPGADDGLPSVLAAGVPYHITRCLVEGWIWKKGTGCDWIGSRAWKARYARLCLGRIINTSAVTSSDSTTVEIPLLCIYWFPNSIHPTTVIILDSTVVMAVDRPINKKRDATTNTTTTATTTTTTTTAKQQHDHHDNVRYIFEIRHASSKDNSTLPMTRTFCTSPSKARDEWVYNISEALLSYNKQKAIEIKHQCEVNQMKMKNHQRLRRYATHINHHNSQQQQQQSQQQQRMNWTEDARFLSVINDTTATFPIMKQTSFFSHDSSPPRRYSSPTRLLLPPPPLMPSSPKSKRSSITAKG